MIKTKICKGDKVVVIKGDASRFIDETTKQPLVCTVLKIDRIKGRALVDMPHPKKREKKGEREAPMKGVEQWKTARYNPKTGEAGGLKVMKRPVHVSNLKLVEKGARKEFGNKG
jgi:ribosomal protein L24